MIVVREKCFVPELSLRATQSIRGDVAISHDEGNNYHWARLPHPAKMRDSQ